MNKNCLEKPVSILMPVCDEADLIEETIEEWVHEVIRFLPKGSELVFDDASRDGTLEIIQRMSLKYPFIRHRHQDHRDGFFNAAKRLYQMAQCPLVFFTDSDGQYVPSEFWKVAERYQGNSFVHGAKENRKDAPHRLIASFFFNLLVRQLFHVKYNDINSAFRLMDRELVMRILPEINCLPTLLNAELLLRLSRSGCAMTEVSVSHRPRKYGISRGIPLRRFILECWWAGRGLFALRNQLLLLTQAKETTAPS